ncbi:MAG: DNA translocase FtsK [Lentisphaeria bacterium]|nr:DNA translocase FtsK [Lentisphaeria bacterium]
MALGKDINGNVVVPDLTQLSHLLIAGTTGSGKSVCINSIILGLLKKYLPAELNFIMADLKVVELCDYKNLPHLQFSVLTEHKEILQSLKWCVEEIHRRSMILASSGCQQLYDYNKISNKKLPYIVYILDELADLMVNDNKLAKKIENAIAKICQKGHSVGIHMIISTARPSNQVITASIARNIPSRLAFRTVSNTCSKVISGEFGAEKLSGCGDMLALLPPNQDLIQIQGAYASFEYMEQIIASVTPQPPSQITPLDLPLDESEDISSDIQLAAKT